MKAWFALVVVILFCGFMQTPTLKGRWHYAGGISNGKIYSAPDGYIQERRYTKDKFEAFLIEKGEKALKYEAGSYSLKADSCFETQTYSLQPSGLTGKIIYYGYKIKNDTLFFNGKLPNGIEVEDRWKRVK